MTLKHVTPHEFKEDGKDAYDQMQPEFLLSLDACRELAGVPFKITSSYRSPEKNRRVGGSIGSMHLKGRAVDILCPDSEYRYKVVKAAIACGLTVGIMRDALHLDNRPNPIIFHYYQRYPAGMSNDE